MTNFTIFDIINQKKKQLIDCRHFLQQIKENYI